MEEIKLCAKCNKPIEVENIHINYCIKCKTNIDKYNKIQSENRAIRAYERAKYHIETYTKDNGKTLTKLGFDGISPVSSKKIVQSFRGKSWVDILSMFDKYDDLVNYIKIEYKIFLDNGGKENISEFGKQHKYITYEIISSIGTEIILNLCGLESPYNKIEDYDENYLNLKDQLGHIPLLYEFRKLSKITITNYAKRFKFKTGSYNLIVKMYSTEEEYLNYLKINQKHKSNIGKLTCNMNKNLLSLDDLENEFRNVFDKCFVDTEIYPSTRLFDKLSKHNSSTYRKKLNMNWSNICKSYGYPTQQKQSIFETYVLKHMSIILNEEYESQKTFPWLIGVNDFPLFCDGYFEKHNLIVEADGRQHRKPYAKFGGEKAFKTLQANDNVKNELIPKHGIKLLRIADNTKWHDVEYLRSRLEEVLGLSGLVAK